MSDSDDSIKKEPEEADEEVVALEEEHPVKLEPDTDDPPEDALNDPLTTSESLIPEAPEPVRQDAIPIRKQMEKYMKCFMPGCKNDSNNSDKTIVRIREDLRDLWCRQANVEYFKVYTQYCCEDHFDPIQDLLDYNFKLGNRDPRFKPTARLRNIPLRFSNDMDTSDEIHEVPCPSTSLAETSLLAKLLLAPQSETIKNRKYDNIGMPSTSGAKYTNKVTRCQICDNALATTEVNVTPKGLRTLQAASERRMDGRFPPDFEGPVQVHLTCRKIYNSEKTILAAMRRVSKLYAPTIDLDKSSVEDPITAEPGQMELRSRVSEVAASEKSWSEPELPEPETSEPELPGPSEPLIPIPEPSTREIVKQRPSSKVEVCRICGCVLADDVVTVRYKGYLALQRASKLRRDNKFPEGTVHELIEVRLHANCRKSYSKESSVNTSIQQRLQREMNPGAYAFEGKFDYLEQCIFCGGDASEEYMAQLMKRPPSKRQAKVYQIRDPDMGARLYRTSLDYPDADYGEFRKRIKDKDLVALQARYHVICYRHFKIPRKRHPDGTGMKRGRQQSEEIQTQMQIVYDYIENNWEDSQFVLEDIENLVPLNIRTITRKIHDHYGMYSQHKNDLLIDYPPMKILKDKWHEEALGDEKSERLRIVKTAANIILEDIRAIHFDNRTYPAASSFLDETNSVVPETLKIFTETVATKYNKNPEGLESTVTALNHTLMTAARPRSFKSPLLLGIGSLIQQKYASKTLIDLLSSVGFCASYKDVTQLEVSVAAKQSKYYKPEFTQFVFDSVESANGQMLVGVQCNTPRNEETTITRREKADRACGSYKTTLKKYLATPALKNIEIEDHRDDTAILPTRGDALWLFGKSEPSLNLPGWDSFIDKMPRDKEYPVSAICPLPIIEAPPTDDAIYTALKEALVKTKDICIVTFDQPMYQRAQDIVNSDSEFSNIVLKLGPFDVIKSFLGVIGYIMSGSGLKELWCSVYAAEHIEKMMTGHAFARAMRAHFMTRSVLFNMITKDFDLTPEERLEIEGILEGDYLPENNQRSYKEPLAITLELLEKKGPTSQLWVQYFRMTTLVAQFLEAERTANWDLHLATLKKMLPYFHASGYFDYAKSCTLYLQDMKSLETKMAAETYEKYTKKGYFAIRWTDNFDWSDRVVEKTMTLLKRPGGVANGTNVTDDILVNWLNASPLLSIVSKQVENFCRPPEDCDPNKDNQDSAKLQTWFEEHNPFAETGNLVSLSTNAVANDLNCHNAEMVGKQMMGEKIGQNYQEVNYERSKCVRPLSFDKSIQVDDIKVCIEPDTILKRIGSIPLNRKSQIEKIKTFFKYELAPYPMSLFDDQGMLEARNYSLFDWFSPIEILDADRHFYVVDGEFLLHKVAWKDDMTASAISYLYVEYVKTHFKNAIIVFSGNNVSDTARRSKVKKSPIVEFQKDTVLTIDRESFLANEKNKYRLIQYLIIDFARSGIRIKLNSNDLHSNIIETALDNAATYDKTFIVSDNADLLIKMCVLSNIHNVFFMKPSREPKYFHFDSICENKIKISMLFLHAVSGCESTSTIFTQNKTRVGLAISGIHMKDLKYLMTIFGNPTSDKNEIAEVGIDFIRRLYDDLNEYNDLNALRFDKFTKSVTKSRYNLARIPPSKEAIKQHMYRTYYQIQKWLGNELSPEEWGWKRVDERLEPITTTARAVPKELLDMISCDCDGICSISCVCKRIRLNCCVLCLNCNGKSCHGIDMDTESEAGYNPHLKCDAFGNPVDTFEASKEKENDEFEKEPEVPEIEPRAKRARRDKGVNGEEMEIEEVYIEDDSL